ncbi:MAG: penicillin-binding protein 2 [Anaerolineales bacterium]|nr:penicillin-binding protein 2 [Anaerolineales bacterium]MCX7609612.1 penicillin-binding protein 2 [Anaerolineales bacterium]MDW8227853.1 penicillin-binding protein 2 [Anaerolineales bacterium]
MNPSLSWRYGLVAALLGLMALAIIVQIVRIQTDPEIHALIGRSETVVRYYYPARGNIYDRDGHLLAGNITVYEVTVSLPEMKPEDIHPIALAAQVYLGRDYETVATLLANPPNGAVSVRIADYVSVEQVEQLQSFMNSLMNDPNGNPLASLGFRAHLGRSYPEGELASNVLGFVTQNEAGYFGVEARYNNLLSGIPVALRVPVDPRRAVEWPQIPPGASIILTIDRELQKETEEILDRALSETGAESGVIIVMNPRNGEILALATTPRIHPAEYYRLPEVFPGETPFNRAISQAYEPGSVMKILTMAAALDAGVVTPGTLYFDTGVINVGGQNIYNWDRGAWGYQDMTGCLAYSLNTCLSWVASQLGAEKFYDYMQAFGIGHPTGIDLDGEITGRLKLPGDEDWTPVELATNSFGQGVSVTPMQLVMAASALANHGQMVYPHVLYATVQDGQQHTVVPQIAGQPIRPETARTISEMLAVALEQEGKRALTPGYRVAGKTGTAQIPTRYGYDPELTNASFIGWGPVDDPQFLIFVWLEKPRSSPWGSVVAAPVFQQVVEKTVVLLGIPPDSVRAQWAGR